MNEITGTIQFKENVRLIGEPTLGNERVMRFSKNKVYNVVVDEAKLSWGYVDLDIIGKAWAQGVKRDLFVFTPAQ